MWCRKIYKHCSVEIKLLKDGGLHNPIKGIFLSKTISNVRISKFPGICLLVMTLKDIPLHFRFDLL